MIHVDSPKNTEQKSNRGRSNSPLYPETKPVYCEPEISSPATGGIAAGNCVETCP